MGTKLERKLRLALASLFFRLFRTEPLQANPFELCPPDVKILVIRQQNQMGDMLLATPCLRALRQSLPKSWITLIASHENEAVVRSNPHVNEILVYEKRLFRKNPLALIRFLNAVRSRGFDVCIILSTVSFSVTSALLCLLSRARYRLTYSGESFGMGFMDKAFHVTVPIRDKEIHQTKLGLKLLEYFGVSTEDLSPVMLPSAEDEMFAEQFMPGSSLQPGGIAVAVHPGAGKKKNRWPPSRFAHTANALHGAQGADVVIIAGPSDREVLNAMLEELEFTPTVLHGESIGRVAAVMKRLSLFICNDTGVLHVAASVGCPTLALFGPTDPERWAPLADCVKTLRAPGSVMDQLKEESVLASAIQMISSKGEARVN